MTVPKSALRLLDLIGSVEAGPVDPYNVIYGHHEKSLPHPITTMTLSALMAAQAVWGHEWGSSAAGRYQIMPQTLAGLIDDLGLHGTELFSPTLQDAFGYQLLVRRGFSQFVARKTSTISFGKALAQEWASFPVLADTQGAHRYITAGQSYYAGDGLNKALLTPAKVEAVLTLLLADPAPPTASPVAKAVSVPSAPVIPPTPQPTEPAMPIAFLPTIVQWIIALLPGIPDDINIVEAELKELASTDSGIQKLQAALTFGKTLIAKIEAVLGLPS